MPPNIRPYIPVINRIGKKKKSKTVAKMKRGRGGRKPRLGRRR
jgi:hypothetical protein